MDNPFDALDAPPAAAAAASPAREAANPFDALDSSATQLKPPPSSTRFTDYLKAPVAGAVEGIGQAISGIGSLGKLVSPIHYADTAARTAGVSPTSQKIADAASSIGDLPQSALQWVGNKITQGGQAIADSESDAAKAAEAKPVIEGSVLHPSTLKLGAGATSPSTLALKGLSLGGAIAPMLLAPEAAGARALGAAGRASETAGEAVNAIRAGTALSDISPEAAQLVKPILTRVGRTKQLAGASSAGVQMAEGAAQGEQARIEQMPDDELAKLPAYRTLTAQGIDPATARQTIAQRAHDATFAASLGPSVGMGFVSALPLLHDSQGVLSRVVGDNRLARAAAGAALEAPVQGAAFTGQNAASIAAANAATGEQRNPLDDSAGTFGSGALMGGLFGLAGGLHRPAPTGPLGRAAETARATGAAAPEPNPGAAPGSLSDVANVLHRTAPAASEAPASPSDAQSTITRKMPPPPVPWINADTGESRTPAASEVVAAFHRMQDDQAQADANNVKLVTGLSQLSNAWGVPLERLKSLRKVAINERAKGITTHDAEQRAAEDMAQQSTTDVFQNSARAMGDLNDQANAVRASLANVRARLEQQQSNQAETTESASPDATRVGFGSAAAEDTSLGLPSSPEAARNETRGAEQAQRGLPLKGAEENASQVTPPGEPAAPSAEAAPAPSEVRPSPEISAASSEPDAGQTVPTPSGAGSTPVDQAAEAVPVSSSNPPKVGIGDETTPNVGENQGTMPEREASAQAAGAQASANVDGGDEGLLTAKAQKPPSKETQNEPDRPVGVEPVRDVGEAAPAEPDVAGARTGTEVAGVGAREGSRGAKEPWQMTREQYRTADTRLGSATKARDAAHTSIERGQRFGETRRFSGVRAGNRLEKLDNANARWRAAFDAADVAHRNAVLKAVSEGKRVPADVLADYPDLKPRSAGSAPRFPLRPVGAKGLVVQGVRDDVRAALRVGGFKKPGTATKDGVRFDAADRPAIERALGATSAAPNEVAAAARESAAHPENPRPEPTPAQHEAGNFKMGHVRLHGMDVSIEIPKGGSRRGTDAKGKDWERKVSDHYGYIRRTEGADGEQVDAYLGPHASDAEKPVFVIDQVKPGTQQFDEHKVMLGYSTGREARASYDANFPKGLKTFGGIRKMALDEFKDWLKNSNLSKPAAATEESRTISKRAVPETITDIGEKIGGARKDTAVKTGRTPRADKDAEGSAAKPGWMNRYEVSQITSSSRVGEQGRWAIHDKRQKGVRGHLLARGTDQTFATKEEAEAAIPIIALVRNHGVGRREEGNYGIYRRVTDRKRVWLKDGFATPEDAKRYMAQHARDLIETKTSVGEEALPKPETVTRKGPARRTADVKPEEFRDTFGFRGVEFGNWNNQAERQEVMNHAYDGLHDLSELLNIPPKAISLNGELGLAFGARGQGLTGARAHYERDHVVMNLTKMQGAGALAHEWFHALDHYLGRESGSTSKEWRTLPDGTRVLKTTGDVSRDMASYGADRASKLRDELRQAYATLINTMQRTATRFVRDTAKLEQFTGNARGRLEEKLARLRDELAQAQRYGSKGKMAPASAERLAEFDAIAQRMVNGENLELRTEANKPAPGRKFSSSYRTTNDDLNRLSAIMKAVRGRAGFSADGHGFMNQIAGLMRAYDVRLKEAADARANPEAETTKPTSFRMEAIKADQGRGTNYWSTHHEMAARAFSAYVEDKLAGEKRTSDFLSYGSKEHFVLPIPELPHPFPGGDERVAIDKAFDAFFKTVKNKEDEAGNVGLFSRPEPRLPDDPISSPEGGINFGEIGKDRASAIRRQAGKIRLPLGTQRADGTGFGKTHIEARHARQIKGAGFDSVESLVQHVVNNYTEVWDAPHGQVLLIADGHPPDAMFLRMQPAVDSDGDYYRVNTAFPISKNRFAGREGFKKLWDGSEPPSSATGTRTAFAATPGNESSPGRLSADRQSLIKSTTNAKTGLDRPTVQKLVDATKAKWGDNKPKVHVVDTPAEFPESARTTTGFDMANHGYYDGRDIWLARSNLHSDQDVLKAMAHEPVHYALDRIMDQHVKGGWKKFTADIDRLRRDPALGSKAMRDAINEVERRYPGSDADTFARELPAVMAERGVKNGILARVVEAIRAFLRRVMPGTHVTEKMALDLLHESGKYLHDDSGYRAQVKMVQAHAFSEAPDTFYSALSEAVNKAKGAPKSADAAAWKQWLDGAQRRGEFKGAEREWMGLDQWLDEQKGPVTREALVQHVRDNQVRVQEVMRRDEIPMDEAAGIHDNDDGTFELVDHEGAVGESTKFGEYTLPGGKNYRELLMTLPVKEFDSALNPGGKVRSVDFQSTHFEQPNILAHVRMNDRTGPEGEKILHVEEVQSDWHQAGRKSGYVRKLAENERPPLPEGWVVRSPDAKHSEWRMLADKDDEKSWQFKAATENGLWKDADAHLRKVATMGFNGVPDAPFKKEWPQLVMKRVLRYAADHGYDKVTWTTGEQQAARYDLSKQVKAIEYMDGNKALSRDGVPRGSYRIHAVNHNNAVVFDKIVPRGDLEGLVGKELAKKIIDDQGSKEGALLSGMKALTGLDLKIGGEGMKAFYDKILPNELGKYVKQWGAKVGETTVRVPVDGKVNAEAVHSLDITPTMRESVMEGQPLFSKRDEDKPSDPSREPDKSVKDLSDVLKHGDPSGIRDQAKAWLRGKAEDLRPAALGALQTRHLLELMEDVPALKGAGKLYGKLMQQMDADRQHLMAGAPDAAEHPTDMLKKGAVTVAQDLRKFAYGKGLRGRVRPEAQKLFDIMHAATIQRMDPSRVYERLTIENAHGDAVPWTPAGVKDRLKLLRELALQRGGDPWATREKLRDEVKYLRKLPQMERLRERNWPKLQADYMALSDEAKRLYAETRDWYSQYRDATEEALVHNIEALNVPETYRRSMVNRMRLQFEEARREGVYFPLNRDGDFWIAFQDKEGNEGFKMFETAKEYSAGEKKLRAAGFQIDAKGRRDHNMKAKDAPSGTFVRDVIDTLAKANVSESVQDQVYQTFLRSLPEMSLRKHSIHRRNIAGFSEDALRAFAKNGYHGAHQLARLRHSQDMGFALEAMKASVDNWRRGENSTDTQKEPPALDVAKADALVGEMQKRHDWIMNPTDQRLANMVNSLGFIYYLGASPASALTNLSQVVQTTLPVLGAEHGWPKATRVLGAAWRDAARTVGHMDRTLTDPEERRAFMVMQQRGDFSKTQAHTLAGLAEGNVLQTTPAWSRSMIAISWMFHTAELVNREATGMAAYRLARAKGMDFNKAVEYAGDVNANTNFDYSAANRPRYMQGNVPRIALQFKNYSVGMTWLFYRNLFQAMKAEDPEVRRVARRTVTGILGMTAILAGTTGLPVYNAVRMTANAANTLWGDDNEPWNFDDAFHRWLADNLGPDAARLIAEGPTNYLTGANLASRTSLSNLWIHDDDQRLEGADAYHALLENLAGPIGGIVNNWYVGTEDVRRGNIERGVERMLPTAVKNSIKAMRYAHEGVNSLRGDPIVPDVSGYQDFLQAIGFQPAAVADQYRINTAMKNYTGEIQDRRSNLMNAYALAIKAGADDDMGTALRKISAFNQAHPEVAITAAKLRASLRQRARLSAQAKNGVVLNRRLAPAAQEYVGATQ